MIKNILFSVIIVLLFSSLVSSQDKKEILGYFPEWGAGRLHYYVKNIETSGSADKLTVLNYAFAVPGPDSSGKIIVQFMNPFFDYQQVYTSAMSIDGAADDSTQSLRGHFNQLKKLKAKHPNLKILISIGGWEGSTYFSDAALTPESREKFVNSCIDIFIKGNLPKQNGAGGIGSASGIFDGIDIDWEFPISGGNTGIHNNPKDNDNLSKLFILFRKKLDEINPNLILTAALPARISDINNFNINSDQQYLNWYSIMTYDYCGSWDTITGHHANLFSCTDQIDKPGYISFDKSIQIFLNKYKVVSNKILAGVAFYGRSWQNVDSINCGLFQKGTTGPGKDEPGLNLYCDLIPKIKSCDYHWDEIAMAPFLYNKQEKIFWTFDDPQSIALKSRYVDAFNLGGVFFWDISGDDSAGTLITTIEKRNMPDIVITNKQQEELPEIKSIQPIIYDIIKEGTNLVIKVNANSSTKKVEFFGDDISLGFDTKLPYDGVWFNIPKGLHTIKAIATNINGITNTKSIQLFVLSK